MCHVLHDVQVDFLNGSSTVLSCLTVNDIKVRVAQLRTNCPQHDDHESQFDGYRQILASEVFVLSVPEGLELTDPSWPAPNHVRVVLCQEVRTERVWRDAFVAYSAFGDIDGMASCVDDLFAADRGFVVRTLLQAVASSDVDVVRALVTHGTDMENAMMALDVHGQTPLHIAVSKDQALLQLLTAGAHVWNSDGNTALHHAVQLRRLDAIRVLALQKDANAQNRDGYPAMHLAIRRGFDDVVDVLLSCGVGANVADREGHSPLHCAVLRGRVDVIRRLLEFDGTEVTARNKHGELALQVAVRCGDVGVAKLILGHSSGVSAAGTPNKDGDLPLHTAVRCGVKAMVDPLLRAYEAAVSVQGKEGRTPLHYAALLGQEEIIDKLLQPGGCVAAAMPDMAGDLPIHTAVRCLRKNMVEMLIARCDVPEDAAGAGGMTPLHYAACAGATDIVSLLLRRNSRSAFVDARNCAGLTALHCAAQVGDASMIGLLISHEADAGAQDHRGMRAIHFAASRGHLRVVAALLAYSNAGQFAHAHSNGKTPLHYAAGRCVDIATLLLEGECSPGEAASARDRAGCTPLHYAAAAGACDAASALLLRGHADATAQDLRGGTPLHAALRSGRGAAVSDLLARLLAQGEHSNGTPDVAAGRSAINMLLAEERQVGANGGSGLDGPHPQCRLRLVEMLLRQNGRGVANAKDEDHWSPLHLAALYGDRECVDLLLEHGADATEKAHGWTPAHFAALGGDEEVMAALQEKGE